MQLRAGGCKWSPSLERLSPQDDPGRCRAHLRGRVGLRHVKQLRHGCRGRNYIDAILPQAPCAKAAFPGKDGKAGVQDGVQALSGGREDRTLGTTLCPSLPREATRSRARSSRGDCVGPYRGGGIGPGPVLQQAVDDVRVALLGGLVQRRVAVLRCGSSVRREKGGEAGQPAPRASASHSALSRSRECGPQEPRPQPRGPQTDWLTIEHPPVTMTHVPAHRLGTRLG